MSSPFSPNLSLSQHFKLKEFQNSEVARKNKINNRVKDRQILNNLANLCVLLEVIRNFAGPLLITSGYRCPELNKKVGGVANSAHVTGCAADIVMPKFDLGEAYKIIGFGIDVNYDQIILENINGREWLHVSRLPLDSQNMTDPNRQELFTMTR